MVDFTPLPEFMMEYFKAFDTLRSEGILVGELIWNFADFMTQQDIKRQGIRRPTSVKIRLNLQDLVPKGVGQPQGRLHPGPQAQVLRPPPPLSLLEAGSGGQRRRRRVHHHHDGADQRGSGAKGTMKKKCLKGHIYSTFIITDLKTKIVPSKYTNINDPARSQTCLVGPRKPANPKAGDKT